MRILVIDDHALFRQGLKHLLRGLDERVEVLEAAGCSEAEKLRGTSFDIILLDLHMPGLAGLDGLAAMRDTFEASRIVVLSGEEDPRQIRRAIDGGAAGFIPKASTPEVLLGALRLILADGVYLPAVALRAVAEPDAAEDASEDRIAELLSDRQDEVLRKAVEGKANKVIARELGISDSTVKAHLSAAFRALGVHNRTEAVYAAARSWWRPARP